MLSRYITAALFAAAVTLPAQFVSPEGADLGDFANSVFSLDEFDRNLKIALRGQTIGYAYAINVQGQLKRTASSGYAVLKQDLPPGIYADPNGIPQHPGLRMNIASVSKPITAATVLKLIQDKKVVGYPNLTVDSAVSPFLPPQWLSGPGVTQLTFRELLSQYSGMNDNGGGTSTASLKQWLATGVTGSKTKNVYVNANLAIFRIVIPYMVSTDANRKAMGTMEITDIDSFTSYTAAVYRNVVRNVVLEPMGIANADLNDTSLNPTRLYNVAAPQQKGTFPGDWLRVGGGGGWYLSAIDLARFLAHLRYNNDLFTPATRLIMNDLSQCPGTKCRLAGWQPPVKGERGVYYFHGGLLKYGNEPQNGMRSVVMNFPNGVQVAMLVNSLGDLGSLWVLVRDAFEQAWS